jgi:hypothetical protein
MDGRPKNGVANPEFRRRIPLRGAPNPWDFRELREISATCSSPSKHRRIWMRRRSARGWSPVQPAPLPPVAPAITVEAKEGASAGIHEAPYHEAHRRAANSARFPTLACSRSGRSCASHFALGGSRLPARMGGDPHGGAGGGGKSPMASPRTASVVVDDDQLLRFCYTWSRAPEFPVMTSLAGTGLIDHPIPERSWQTPLE